MVKFGTYVGVAENDITAGQVGALAVNGIFRIPASVGAFTPSLGDEYDVDFTDQDIVPPGTGDADVKVFAADDYATVPTEVDMWLNKVG